MLARASLTAAWVTLRPSSADVFARDAPLPESVREPLQVVGPDIERGDPEDRPAHRISKVHPDATVRGPGERHIGMAHGASDANGRNPAEGAFDPPAGNVGHGRPETDSAESSLELALGSVRDLRVGEARSHPPEQPKQRPGSSAEPDGKRFDRHPASLRRSGLLTESPNSGVREMIQPWPGQPSLCPAAGP
jgi:hypothetical protein